MNIICTKTKFKKPDKLYILIQTKIIKIKFRKVVIL